MSSRIRFHLDEQVKSVIARELRYRGIDVTTTVEVGLRTQSNEAQLKFMKYIVQKKWLDVLSIFK